jgi:colanic acid/amylovoran biosynthesis glycosyltransferase
MRIDYLTSRFPRTSETFIVRELDRLAALDGIEVGIRSLFSSPDVKVHTVARPWVERLVRPGWLSTITGVGWAVTRHPRRLGAALVLVVHSHAGTPVLLARALLTCALACSHARDLRSQRVHLHAHFATYPALAAWLCHRLLGISYSITVHAHDLYVDQTMLTEKVSEAACVVTISRYNVELLTSLGTGTPIELVRCGIDTAAYLYRVPCLPSAGPVRGLCVASLQEYKGHAVLLRALVDVPRLQLDLIGDGPLRGELEDLARSVGVADRVRFLGARTELDVRAALLQAELFVLPSIVAADGQMEGVPVALMEAMASGVPVVSTRLSGVPELVIDGQTGRLAEANDAASLATTLRLTLAETEVTTRLARAARVLVEGEFELDTAVGRLSEIFASIEASRGRPVAGATEGYVSPTRKPNE